MAINERRKILLIDDDTSLLTTLADFLAFEGYDVETADTAEAGLAILDSVDPDLIILDMSMPGMGGVGFLREVTDGSGKPSHPVLVLTARANMAEFFANVEVDGFVAKPCDPQDLLMEVSRIIFLRAGDQEDASRVGGNKLVLLGESDASEAIGLVQRLEAAGFDVKTIATGPAMLEEAIVSKPAVIILKAILEGMNGDRVADMLKTMPNTKDIPVVVYDSSGMLSFRQCAADAVLRDATAEDVCAMAVKLTR